MADLTITAANVIAGNSAKMETGTAGATVTAGQVVYKDSADNKFKLADNDSATAGLRSPYGIALHASLAGQPLTVITRGALGLGAILTAGTPYILSSTPGAIAPAADLGSGDYNTVLGVATSTSSLKIDIQEAGVVTV